MLVLVSIAALGACAILLIYAALHDLLTYTIPNRVSLALVAAFAVYAASAGLALDVVGWHLAAGAIALACGFGLFAARLIGGGDAKLAAAIALWLGWSHLLTFVVAAGLAGGALTLVIVGLRALPVPIVIGGWTWLDKLQDSKSGIPYGIALSAGALFVLPRTPVWTAIFGG